MNTYHQIHVTDLDLRDAYARATTLRNDMLREGFREIGAWFASLYTGRRTQAAH